MKVCSKCNLPKDEERDFYKDRNGKIRAACKECFNTLYRHKIIPDDNYRTKARKWRKDWRANPSNLAKVILLDCKKADSKFNRDMDLTVEFIQSLIKDGCSYCGNSEIRMTLDRINNQVGHIQTNVVPACIRCNYIRGEMPYEAWLALVPAIKEATEKGLFGEWDGRRKKANQKMMFNG